MQRFTTRSSFWRTAVCLRSSKSSISSKEIFFAGIWMFGSGTFLALCLRKAFDYADRYLIRPDELVAKLLTNITGFDLNPLAVIAARTNFLLGLGTLIRHAPRIEIPVYFCDSIITPSEY